MENLKIAQKKRHNTGVSIKYFGVKQANVIDTERKIIEVKFASFGNIDSDRDLLVKGCFAKSIRERGPESSTNRKIAFVWQHDIKDPIGKILSIEEREDGAYATVRLSDFDAVPNAKRAYYQLMDGDINQFSFGFEYIWDKIEYDESLDAYIVKEVKLYEISVVTLGANEQTEFIRSIENTDTLKNYLEELSRKDKDTFIQIKQFIGALEAEPVRPLTLHQEGLFDKLSQIN